MTNNNNHSILLLTIVVLLGAFLVLPCHAIQGRLAAHSRNRLTKIQQSQQLVLETNTATSNANGPATSAYDTNTPDAARVDFTGISSSDICFPLRDGDINPASSHIQRSSGSWGQYRPCRPRAGHPCKPDGASDRCHTGYDILTRGDGLVRAVAAGKVVGITNPGWTTCSGTDGGWRVVNGVRENGPWSPAIGVVAVYVKHEGLGVMINYGEINANDVRVANGADVVKGTIIGTASHCGMLHFEMYSVNQRNSIQWPAQGSTSDAQCRTHVPANVKDPRPFLEFARPHSCPDV